MSPISLTVEFIIISYNESNLSSYLELCVLLRSEFASILPSYLPLSLEIHNNRYVTSVFSSILSDLRAWPIACLC